MSRTSRAVRTRRALARELAREALPGSVMATWHARRERMHKRAIAWKPAHRPASNPERRRR